MIGNRQYSTDELMQYFPFGRWRRVAAPRGRIPFNRTAWEKATEAVQNLYANTGYIYAQVVPEEIRRTGADSQPVVDLRWNIREGNVVTVNKINIVGNDVTHERVIREAVVLVSRPGVQPGGPHPLLAEHRQPRVLPAADAVARRGALRDPHRGGHHLPGGGKAHRQHQLRRIARAGHRYRRVHRARGAQPLRPGQARQAAVAVRPEHPGPEPVLHRPQHPGNPDFRHALDLRFPRPVRRRRPRSAPAGRRADPVRLPAAGVPVHPAVRELRSAADLIYRRLDRPPAPATAVSSVPGPPLERP